MYCTDCQNAAGGHGISLCKHCSDLLHTGATRRGHNIAGEYSDGETLLAVVYCTDCQNAAGGHGITLCKHCSDLLHTGATRRRHNIAG